jgi:hypothetical protein
VRLKLGTALWLYRWVVMIPIDDIGALVNRKGTFYGQCSEIGGTLHTSMPIVIESASI